MLIKYSLIWLSLLIKKIKILIYKIKFVFFSSICNNIFYKPGCGDTWGKSGSP